MSPRATPNAAASRRSPATRGRQIAHSTTAANASRRNAVPAGPSAPNSVTAKAAPICGDAAETMTRTTATARSRPMGAGSARLDVTRQTYALSPDHRLRHWPVLQGRHHRFKRCDRAGGNRRWVDDDLVKSRFEELVDSLGDVIGFAGYRGPVWMFDGWQLRHEHRSDLLERPGSSTFIGTSSEESRE